MSGKHNGGAYEKNTAKNNERALQYYAKTTG